jgi:hypothetical protein
VLSLFPDTVFWHNKEEHMEIRNCFCEKYFFAYSVDSIDETNFDVAFKLELDG